MAQHLHPVCKSSNIVHQYGHIFTIGILSIILVACGGGGGGDSDTETLGRDTTGSVDADGDIHDNNSLSTGTGEDYDFPADTSDQFQEFDAFLAQASVSEESLSGVWVAYAKGRFLASNPVVSGETIGTDVYLRAQVWSITEVDNGAGRSIHIAKCTRGRDHDVAVIQPIADGFSSFDVRLERPIDFLDFSRTNWYSFLSVNFSLHNYYTSELFPGALPYMDATILNNREIVFADDLEVSMLSSEASDDYTLLTLKARKIRDDIDLNVGTVRIDDSTIDLQCFEYEHNFNQGSGDTGYSHYEWQKVGGQAFINNSRIRQDVDLLHAETSLRSVTSIELDIEDRNLDTDEEVELGRKLTNDENDFYPESSLSLSTQRLPGGVFESAVASGYGVGDEDGEAEAEVILDLFDAI